MNQLYPSLNEFEVSYADIAVTATPLDSPLIDMIDIAGIKWDSKVEVGVARGASGGRVRKRTTGSVTDTASAELYRSGYRRLVKGLMTAAIAKGFVRGNQVAISLVSFDIVIHHTPIGDNEIFTANLLGCRLLGRGMDHKEGDDADKVAVDLNPIQIVEFVDGKEVVLL